MPTQRLAHYLQQEAAVICFQNNKVSAQKLILSLKRNLSQN